MYHNKRLISVLIVALIALMTIGPILAKGDGKPDKPGNSQSANSGGNGSHNSNKPDAAGNPQPSTTTVESDPLLGCQKNNPNRLDCSSLEVTAVCEGGVAIFTITNTGEPGDGDMRAPTQYRLIVDGVVVQTGSVQLAGGATMQISYSGGGTVTLEADQQIGHPGGSLPQATVTCGVPTATETATPTEEVTPTEEPSPTEEVTPTEEPSLLLGRALCPGDGSTLFIVSNTGSDMSEQVYYVVTDMYGNLVTDGWLQLMTGEAVSIQVWGDGLMTLDVGNGLVVVSAQCVTVTEEPTPTEEVTPTPEETPTEEVTPTPEPTVEVTPTPEPTEPPTFACQKNNPDRLDCSSLEVTAVCEGGVAVFSITNTGEAGNGDMVASTQYRLSVAGVVVETGSVQIAGGTSTQITYSGGGTVTLEADQQVGHPGGSLPQSTITCGG